ncbi:MAG: hypothetical protein Q9183_005737, partial [Haloplaca sp. 2 TL-2023]
MPALYDTFLVQEPLRQDPFAVTHNPSDVTTLLEVYKQSSEYFTERDRRRAVERLQYELGLLHIQGGQWRKALSILRRLWEDVRWRTDGWWSLLQVLAEAVKDCARRCGDWETIVQVEWELMSDCFSTTTLGKTYDLARCLEGAEGLDASPKVVRRENQFPSPLSLTAAFGAAQGNVGEVLPMQIMISSHSHQTTAPLALSRIVMSFDGGLKDVCIEHKPEPETPSGAEGIMVYDISLNPSVSDDASSPTSTARSSNCLYGVCDLTLRPGKRKAISFNVIPRDSGTVRVTSIVSSIHIAPWTLDFVVSEAKYLSQEDILMKNKRGLSRRHAGNRGSNEIRIYPKPPKLRIGLPTLKKEYLTDETVVLDVEIANEEDDDAEVTLECQFLGQADDVPTLTWVQETTSHDPLSNHKNQITSRLKLGCLEKGGSRTRQARFVAKRLPTETVLEIKASYNLLSEPDTSISKVFVQEVIIDRPFEANYDLKPCIDTDPWPSYFSFPAGFDDDHPAQGLRQVWQTTARLASFAPEPLVIESLALELLHVQEGAICDVSTNNIFDSTAETMIAPNDFYESKIRVTSQKKDLDDRRSTAIKFQLRVRWRRQSTTSSSATTIVPAPDLTIPFGEPRVLASTDALEGNEDTDIIPLSYTIENPSTHVLNFDISMETSDEFAFSGPKSGSVNLVP